MASFIVICFADLKRYRFTYLFGFPALHSDPLWKITASTSDGTSPKASVISPQDNSVNLSSAESTALVDSVQTWRYSTDARQYGFFLAKKQRDGLSNSTGDYGSHEDFQERAVPQSPSTNIGFNWVIGSLASYEQGFFDGVDFLDQYICFADPCTYRENPGWMLRNLLILIRKRWKLTRVQVLCYRETQSRRDDARSLILRLELTQDPTSEVTMEKPLPPLEMPRVSGWERSGSDKLRSKVANLGEYLDPQR